MGDMKKILKIKYLFIILIVCSITAVFAYTYNATMIGFTPRSSDWNVDNVDEALNDLYISTQSYLVFFDINEGKSDIFSSLILSATDELSDVIVTVTPTFKEGHSLDDIYEFILVVDDKMYTKSSTTTLVIENYDENRTYNLKVIAISKDAKMHSGSSITYTTPYVVYERQVLTYPLLMGDGIKNVKYNAYPDTSKSYYEYDPTVEATASDALPKAAYDGDLTTYAGPYNIVYKYMDIDPSAYGKTLNVRTNGAYSYYVIGKWSADTRSSSYNITIPSGATRISLYGNESLKFYELTIN